MRIAAENFLHSCRTQNIVRQNVGGQIGAVKIGNTRPTKKFADIAERHFRQVGRILSGVQKVAFARADTSIAS